MKTFAVIENNKVVNIIVGVEDEIVAANPDKYIEYTNGWDFNNGIDGGEFFVEPINQELLNDFAIANSSGVWAPTVPKPTSAGVWLWNEKEQKWED